MEQLEIFKVVSGNPILVPIRENVPAGFPSPAQDYRGDVIDLNEEFIFNNGNTYYVRVHAGYLSEPDVESGDSVLVDTTLRPNNGDLALCVIDGERMLKYVEKSPAGLFIYEGADSQRLEISRDNDAFIWGVVTFIFKKRRHRGRRPKRELTLLDNVRTTQEIEKRTNKRAIFWGTREDDDDCTPKYHSIDLEKELEVHALYSEYGRITGFSLEDDDIIDGDSVIIEKVMEVNNGDLAVSYFDGGFTLKYVKVDDSGVWLLPASGTFPPIRITDENRLLIWGVITVSIRQLRFKKRK